MASPNDPRPRSFLRRFALDVEPLRVSRDFRLIWTGLFISELGYQFTLVAIFVQVYALTGSAAAVGLTGLFSFLALVLGSVISGAVVDAYDRRKLLMLAQVGFAVGSGILFVGALAGTPPDLGHLPRRIDPRAGIDHRQPHALGDGAAPRRGTT